MAGAALCTCTSALWFVAGTRTHFTLYTLHSTLYTLHSTLYTPHSTHYTPHSTLHTLHSTLYTLHTPHFTLHTPHSTLHAPHSTLHTPHSTLYTLLHSTLYTSHFTIYTLHSTLHTLHSTALHALHFTLHASHTTLHTLHSTLHTLHPTLQFTHCTLHTPYFTPHTPPHSTTLHHTPPHSTTLHHTPPHSTTPHHTPPHPTTLHHTPPHSTTLHHTPPHSTTLHHTPPHSTTLHHTPPHSTTLHHTPPHSTLYTLHTPYFTLRTPYFTLHTPHSTLYTPYFIFKPASLVHHFQVGPPSRQEVERTKKDSKKSKDPWARRLVSSFLKYPWFGRGGVQSSWNQVAKVYGCFLYSLHLKALLGGLQGDSCSTHLPQLVDSNQTWRFSQSLSNLWRVAQHSCQASVAEFHPAPQRPVPRQRPAPLFGNRMLWGISSRWKPILFTPRNTAWLVNKLDHLRILSHTTRCKLLSSIAILGQQRFCCCRPKRCRRGAALSRMRLSRAS